MCLTKEQFKKNLLATLEEMVGEEKNKEYQFIIIPIIEDNVTYNSTDDYIRLGMLDEKNIKDRLFTIDEAVNFLAQPDGKYPLWIKVSLSEKIMDRIIFELKISMRFRTPTQLKYVETGHPPFIYEK